MLEGIKMARKRGWRRKQRIVRKGSRGEGGILEGRKNSGGERGSRGCEKIGKVKEG